MSKVKNQVKRIHIGNAAVDSGMLMIVDPCYVLRDKYTEKHGIKKASDSFDTDYGKAIELSHQGNGDEAEEVTVEERRKIAFGAVCTTGRGDGEFPVYAVYEDGELVGMEVRFD